MNTKVHVSKHESIITVNKFFSFVGECLFMDILDVPQAFIYLFIPRSQVAYDEREFSIID